MSSHLNRRDSIIIVYSGETKFAIQISHKNCTIPMSAGDVLTTYDLNDYTFHAEMIRQAASGTLIAFLQKIEKEPAYKITSKRQDRETQELVFTISTKEGQIYRTSEEIARDKEILLNLSLSEVYEIGFTHGNEHILKEKSALLLAHKFQTFQR